MMKLDHIVHLVSDPKEVAAQLIAAGLHVVEGGRHPSWGTYNYLSYFGLSYLELLGIENLDVAKQAKGNPLVRQAVDDLAVHEGFARIAIRTSEIQDVAQRLKEQGFPIIGPIPGSRTRQDGSVLQWSLLFVEDTSSTLPMPFFIQWEEEDTVRYEDLVNRKIIAPHPVGNLSISHVAMAVQDLEATKRTWESILGLAACPDYIDTSLNARCFVMELDGGNLVFCTPIGEGMVTDVLKSRGERPFLLAFNGAKKPMDLNLSGSRYLF
jgi:vacuolar-type H+-ATPase subunit F/Vma7